MRIAQSGRQIALAFPGYKQLEFFAGMLFFISSWPVMSVVVFLRKEMGERYLGTINLLFGYMAIGSFVGFGGAVISYFTNEKPSRLMSLLVLAFFGLSIYHRHEMRKRDKAGNPWHSMFSGIPRLKLIKPHGNPWLKSLVSLPMETINKWVEPGLLIALSFLMRAIHQTPVALWLFISGVCLFMHEHISYYFQRAKLLDIRDSRIEAQYWQSAMEGRSVRETHGYFIAESNRALSNEMPEVKDPFESLSDLLRDILDKEDKGGRAA